MRPSLNAGSLIGSWLLLILSMAVASVAVLSVGAVFGGGAWFTPVVVSVIAGVVALTTAVAGVVYLPFRDSILRPRFPYLRRGYLWVAAPGLPFSIFGVFFDVEDFPLVQLVAGSLFFEAVVLTGAIIFVIVGRAWGFFDAQIARHAENPDSDRKNLQTTLITVAVVVAAGLLLALPPSHRGLVGRYDLAGPSAAGAVTLQLRADGIYRLCAANCASGSYVIEQSNDPDDGWIRFDGGPMRAFLTQYNWGQTDAAEARLQLRFLRHGIELPLGDETYFSGGCYFGLVCNGS